MIFATSSIPNVLKDDESLKEDFQPLAMETLIWHRWSKIRLRRKRMIPVIGPKVFS